MTTPHHCVLNVGHYRTGSATLAKAAKIAGYRVHRAFFQTLDPSSHKLLLLDPEKAVWKWWTEQDGRSELSKLIESNDFVCDGYVPWLLLLPERIVSSFCQEMTAKGISLSFIATTRQLETLVVSELHHWVVHALEAEAGLDEAERDSLEKSLRKRATLHSKVLKLHSITSLALEEISFWAGKLDKIFDLPGKAWSKALKQAGHQNVAPTLPLQGVLLTLRIGTALTSVTHRVGTMIKSLKQDRLCNMIVVLALDDDEEGSPLADQLVEHLQQYCRIIIMNNPPKDPSSPFPICQVWDRMAATAFEEGCDWVMLLGDDIAIDCAIHFRLIYRAFLDISKKLGCPFGFGCPWWNDTTFSGFPTFPVVGKAHYEIFESLVPPHRARAFINQDLDPYIQRMYLKFGAAPLLQAARLSNNTGGNNINPTRYERVAATGWRDWVLQDVRPVKEYLSKYTDFECILLDVVVPSYRIDLEYLERICRLQVPENVRTTFIIVIDNPVELNQMYGTNKADDAAILMEIDLAEKTKNNIRVRCNSVNSGASASRNRGLDESAAEYILMLDDDVIPNNDLLYQYETTLQTISASTVGIVGMVRFPRRSDLPLLHAAVLMSYLTFMFEIASNEKYKNPAWGVTANLLVRRSEIRFDTVYAKTGGGEDVDFALRLVQETGGRLLTNPQALVTHEYWPGGMTAILAHFYRWAIGDSALFKRSVRYV
ncbi:hypothetical protein MPSEU_000745800 [Mayamaea pseudoterrestris]|nr:hypothetical protein MPSEU_000745800 [Mayamaea pseudoterrestris]